jgi:hypothetical protein
MGRGRRVGMHLLTAFALLAVPASRAQTADAVAQAGTGEAFNFSIQVQIAPPQSSNSFYMTGVAGPLGARPVTGKPLAAEIVTERHQVLQGEEVTRSTTSVIYRDGEGRIRRESQLLVPGLPADVAHFSYITIVDQQRGCGWYLDPQEKVAQRYELNGSGPSYVARVSVRGSGSEALREPSGVADDASHLQRSGPGQAIAMKPVAAGAAQGGVHGVASAPEMRINQPFLAAPHPVRIENLGEELILGVRAHGTRIITTVPAGQIGNDHAIDIVSEQWYAPELDLVMRGMHRDPWGGEIDTRVTKLTPGDQPASLFQVPHSYKIVDSARDPEHRVLDVRSGHAPGTPPW